MKLRALFASALFVLGCGASTGVVRESNEVAVLPSSPPPTGKLPVGVTPLHYAITQTIDPAAEGFSGEVTVRVRIDAPRSQFWMHAHDLVIDEVALTGEHAAQCTHTLRAQDQLVSIECPDLQGERDVHIKYHAAWHTGLDGLYRVQGGQDWYAFTQFEATDARYAFPCFDEPRFKTPFDVTLRAPVGHVALANSSEVGEAHTDGAFAVHRFATTPKLPTYLVAFAVGPFDVVNAPAIAANDVRSTPLPFRGIALKGKGAKLQKVLELTPRIVQALEQYTGIAHPYDKLDLVAVPDFGAGAMENAGLITFREQLLLLDESSTLTDLREVVSVTAHELAHQWFGNLVTMPWWDDIWLNEAFATWFGTKIHHAAFPDHDADLDLLQFQHWAMDQDSLASSRRVREPIVNNHDISNAFDAITYGKGSALLAMFEQALGHDVFQRAIRRYLNAHAFGVATTDDLLTALVRESGNNDIRAAFAGFLDQPGVPLVKMSRACEQSEPAPAHLTSTRYLPLGSSADASLRWTVPVCVRTDAAAEPACTFLRDVADVNTPPAHWTMLNANAAGYFRIAFDRCALDALLQHGFTALSVREKMALADGLRAALFSNAMPARDVIAALDSFVADAHPSVVSAGLDMFALVNAQLLTDAERPRLRARLTQLLSRRARALGWTARAGESPNDTLLRSTLLSSLLLVAEDRGLRREALTRAKKYLGRNGDAALDLSAAAPELFDAIMLVAGRDGDAALRANAEAHMRASTDAGVRRRMLMALVQTSDEAAFAHGLALSLDPALRLNEVHIPVMAAMSDYRLRPRAWTWFAQNASAVLERMTAQRGERLMRATEHFCSTEDAQAVQQLFSPLAPQFEGGPRRLSMALESIRTCAARATAQAASAREAFAPTRRRGASTRN